MSRFYLSHEHGVPFSVSLHVPSSADESELKRCFPRTVKGGTIHPDCLCRSASSKQTDTDALKPCLFCLMSERVDVLGGREGGGGLSSRFVPAGEAALLHYGQEAPSNHAHGPRCSPDVLGKGSFMRLFSSCQTFFIFVLSVLQEKSLTTWSHMEE